VPNLKRVIWIVRLMLFGAPMALLFSKPDLIIDAKELEKILSLRIFTDSKWVNSSKFSSKFKNSLETPKCKNLFYYSQNKRSKYEDQSTKIRVVVQYYQK
jgi:hypothetical protein